MQSSVTELKRSEVAGYCGAVAAGHQLVADVGAQVLEEGGNAMDAAICAAFMCYVVEPAMAGLGGHGRLAVYDARSKTTTVIDHFIVAPRTATTEAYEHAIMSLGGSLDDLRFAGPLAVGVFGTVAGIEAAHKRFATMPLGRLLEPAIEMAERGAPVDLGTQQAFIARLDELEVYSEARNHLLDNGRVPGAGVYGPMARFDQSDLARTLRMIAEKGAAAIYDGPIAEAIEREMKRLGGLLTAGDLREYKPRIGEDMRYAYRDIAVSTCADSISIETLNILQQFDVGDLDPEGPEFRHLLALAQGQAMVDAEAYAGDPSEGSTPFAGLTSKDYAASLAKAIDRSKAPSEIVAGDPMPFDDRPAAARQSMATAPFHGTTKVCSMDERGNAVSFITSLGSAFGSLVLVPGTGIYLGNAMKWFDPRPGRVNSVSPGRMPVYGAPVLLAYDDKGACGAIAGSGGFRIQSAVLVPFLLHKDFGVPVQKAVEAARQFHDGKRLELDEWLPPGTLKVLAEMGHRVDIGSRHTPLSRRIGRSAVVWREADGSIHAGGEPGFGGASAV